MPYKTNEHTDHHHCWERAKDYPPCGQKIKHFHCCLCGELHPDINVLREQDRKDLVNEERNRFSSWIAEGCAETYTMIGLAKFLRAKLTNNNQ